MELLENLLPVSFTKIKCLLVANELPVTNRHFSLLIEYFNIKILKK